MESFALPPSSRANATWYDNRKFSSSAPDMKPSVWPRQDEVTRWFNLNHGGLLAPPATNLNLPRMAPVSLRRDDGHPDNMFCCIFFPVMYDCILYICHR